MNERTIIDFCIQHGISVEQYFILYLSKERARGHTTQFFRYNEISPWDKNLIVDLASKKYITVRNPEYITRDTISVNEGLFEQLFDSEEYSNELYMSYPMTFPIGDSGATFIARTGISREDLAKVYSKKIKFSAEKHKFVMEQLQRYIKMVADRKINGHKLSQWVNDEMWDTIAQIETQAEGSVFKTDI